MTSLTIPRHPAPLSSAHIAPSPAGCSANWSDWAANSARSAWRGSGQKNIILVNSPRYVHQVLVEHAASFHKGPTLKLYVGHFLGNGILTSEGDFHRHQRKMMAPSFMPRRIATYADIMVEYSENAQQGWADGSVVDISKEMMRLTLGIVGKTLFGADVLGEAEELGDALTVAMHHMIRQARSPFHLPRHWNTPANQRSQRALDRIDQTVFRFHRGAPRIGTLYGRSALDAVAGAGRRRRLP